MKDQEEYFRPPLTIKVNKSASSYSLLGRKLKLRLAIDSSEYYTTYGNGIELIDEICASVEQILEKHALLNQKLPP